MKLYSTLWPSAMRHPHWLQTRSNINRFVKEMRVECKTHCYNSLHSLTSLQNTKLKLIFTEDYRPLATFWWLIFAVDTLGENKKEKDTKFDIAISQHIHQILVSSPEIVAARSSRIIFWLPRRKAVSSN